MSIDKPVRSQYITKEQFQHAMRQYNELKREQRNRNRAFSGGGQQSQSNWTPAGSQPPNVGVVAGTDHHVVSFKTGGPQENRTIIADGDYSDDPEGFNGTPGNRGHNDYGPRREGPGYFAEDRGKYTGPGH